MAYSDCIFSLYSKPLINIKTIREQNFLVRDYSNIQMSSVVQKLHRLEFGVRATELVSIETMFGQHFAVDYKSTTRLS